MAKGLTITAIVVAVLLLLLFGLDLAIAFPFKKQSLLIDVAFVICALGLAFLGWTTWRELD
jgi:hypothetical protein